MLQIQETYFEMLAFYDSIMINNKEIQFILFYYFDIKPYMNIMAEIKSISFKFLES